MRLPRSSHPMPSTTGLRSIRHSEIAAAWNGAVQGQRDIAFAFDLVGTAGARGNAHWHTRFTTVPDGSPVELDGILIAEFAGAGQCRIFREWWHRQSPAA